MDENKIKGMLWGLIVGDAFGSPIQFSGKDDHPWITEMVACPVFGLPAGHWTDDGSMAMCVMDSVVRTGGYDLKDVGNTFVKWLFEGYLSSVDGRSFDVGGATYGSVSSIRRGNLVNGHEDSQGNGSIMRFAPSYLLARALKRPEVIHEVSDLTHASRAVRNTCDELAAVLDEHLAGKRTTRGPGVELARSDVPNSGWCVETLTAALWAFNTTETFADGLVAAVNLGGNSDSIGAVYGQIAGAYYGFDAIPTRWVRAVKTWKRVDALIDRFCGVLAQNSGCGDGKEERGTKRTEKTMIGAIVGDIAGSRFEFHNRKTKDFSLLVSRGEEERCCHFTDDTVMTLAVAQAIIDWRTNGSGDMADLSAAAVSRMQEFGRRFPRAGYGGHFAHWICAEDPQPYNSWGNGAAMRVSACGWAGRTLDEVKTLV
ncbi:MAG: ADP-ribosylglycohydrolase family protein [Kiritimatiellae bacterium]|nr:ADP-ribosylglycohydrolase family protein [Kiritimatiellia bacterium]